MSNMSAYYSSMLPPSSLPGSSAVTSQDSLYAHDGKYDTGASSFFNSAAANAAARYESCAPDNSFPRYPPFERFDAMSGTGLVSKSSYMPTTSATYAPPGLPGYTLPAQHPVAGSTHYDDACKLPQDTSPGSASAMGTSLQPSAASAPVNTHPVAMMSQFNTNPLSNMLNGMHHPQAAQNIPIYPWMRPMNGGETDAS